ncbi:hypothetical protein P5V15_002335 [Pogonomyrmex californicus]
MAEIILNTTINQNKYENEETESYCKNNGRNHIIESQITNENLCTEIENLHSIPNKTDNLQNLPSANYKTDVTGSPHKNTFLFRQKDLVKSPLFKNLVFNKSDTQSINTTELNTYLVRKRTISASSDYDLFKSELDDIENFGNNFNNIENISLLHDLDSIVKFEDSKVSSILLSSMLNVNAIQETDDSMLEATKDPVTDPLSISDHEEKDTNKIMDPDTKINKKSTLKMELKPELKRRRSSRLINKYPSKKQKCDLNTEEKHLFTELESINKCENLPLILIKKLQELYIKLIHKVPRQHKIELSGSHAPSRKEKILFQKYGPIRNGTYTPAEDKIIMENWKTFCRLHDWDTKRTEPFLNWRHNGKYYIDDVKERRKFVQFLANGLPWRTLYSVHSRFKTLYSNKITRQRYTSKEDKKILMYIQNKHLDKRNTKYTELAKLLKRTSRSIFKRYQYLKKFKDERRSEVTPSANIKWTLPLIKRFIKTLLTVTLSEDIRELKGATLPKPVWQKMETKLNIHENVLKTFWQHQLHLQLFSTGPIYLNDIKIQLIEYMYEKGISSTREIIWPNVAQYFDGATAIFLCKTFFYLVQECNMNDVDNFADVVEYLYRTKIPEIQKAQTDKFLPRIIYKDGKISLLNAKNNDTIIIENDQESNHHETDQETDHDTDFNT